MWPWSHGFVPKVVIPRVDEPVDKVRVGFATLPRLGVRQFRSAWLSPKYPASEVIAPLLEAAYPAIIESAAPLPTRFSGRCVSTRT